MVYIGNKRCLIPSINEREHVHLTLWSECLVWLLATFWSVLLVRTLPDLLRIPNLSRLPQKRVAPKGSFDANSSIQMSRVSVVIAACNEEERMETTLKSLASQTYTNLEFVIVNDRSTDATGTIIRRFATNNTAFTQIDIDRLPSAWLGKNHALYQGAKRATGEWLLFADADVFFYPDAIERAMSYVHDHQVDHLTVAPELIVRGYWLRMLTSVFTFNYVIFKRPQSAYRRSKRMHAGIGAFNLIKRQAYVKSGTHEAIALRPDDDVAIGNLIKRQGFRQQFAVARDCIEIEWYPNLHSMMVGLEKSPLTAFRYSASLVVMSMAIMMALFAGPFIGVLVEPGWRRIICCYTLLVMAIPYVMQAWYLRLPAHQFLLLPIGIALYGYAFLRAITLAIWRCGLVWRQTFYSLQDLRKGL